MKCVRLEPLTGSTGASISTSVSIRKSSSSRVFRLNSITHTHTHTERAHARGLLTLSDDPLDAEFGVSELHHLTHEVVLIPAGGGGTGTGQEAQSRLEQGHGDPVLCKKPLLRQPQHGYSPAPFPSRSNRNQQIALFSFFLFKPVRVLSLLSHFNHRIPTNGGSFPYFA